uniref:Ketoreductase (KR) domain-containing protein n=1 Tax=Schizophyllum commune (strain H4-8 / FGSC 9210) TaxID=578458 RepID=D8PM37_SCHCM
MVVHILGTAYETLFPKQYLYHICAAILALYVIRTLSQGRKTSRDRDLHGRVVLMTGAFTPLGLTLMESLAARGAHIIALSPEPIDLSPPPLSASPTALLIEALRTASGNQHIYAEHCDIESPAHIRAFCTRFLTGNDTRLDAIVFAHEAPHVGNVVGGRKAHKAEDAKRRSVRSLATFLITTLLLPALLVAPPERDIRIVHVVNPFYAAGAGMGKTRAKGLGLKLACTEGARALRTIVYSRHLQRVLDALPAAQVPKTDAEAGGANAASVPVVSQKEQRSNITTVSVSPGISRLTTIAPMLGASESDRWSWTGFLFYVLLNPLFRLLAKGSSAAIQSILHALFVPTPFKILAGTVEKDTTDADGDVKPRQEVLKPGALYAECAVVPLEVTVPDEWIEQDAQNETAKAEKEKGKAKAKSNAQDETLSLADDREYGGERAGRAVWEAFEAALKVWEASEEKEKPAAEGEKSTAAPSS